MKVMMRETATGCQNGFKSEIFEKGWEGEISDLLGAKFVHEGKAMEIMDTESLGDMMEDLSLRAKYHDHLKTELIGFEDYKKKMSGRPQNPATLRDKLTDWEDELNDDKAQWGDEK